MNIFEAITEYAKRDYTNFDMSNQWIGSVLDFGSLNCIYGKTVIASDTWKTSHALLCKLPPLTAPAFTRIKGIVNTFYTSYASVWKHWNSFISNKPSDQYLSRNQQSAFNGKFVEPCVDMRYIYLIGAIAQGNVKFTYDITSAGTNTNFTINLKIVSHFDFPWLWTWTFDQNGYRHVTRSSEPPSDSIFDSFTLNYVIDSHKLAPTDSAVISYAKKFGFSDFKSYFVYLCQGVYRNLINHGIPVDTFVHGSLNSLSGDFLNLLPFISESSVWHNFYRDSQNQSPELNYEEVNGSIYPFVSTGSAPYPLSYEQTHKMPYGWRIRVIDTPLNINPNYLGYLNVSNSSIAFSVLTGLFLDYSYIPQENNSQEFESLYIVPQYYNSLLGIKYRNFDKDYFTSASTDPLLGGMSIATPNTIDALRTASKLEEFLERSTSARDFYNFMKYNFGSNPESTRYSKPLLLGTEVMNIQIGEQLQSSQTTQGDDGSPLGTRAGVAEGFGNAGTSDHYFNEHGWICSFLSFTVDNQYMQGIDSSDFIHHNQLDYPFPDFANLGAEPIFEREIYYSTASHTSMSRQSVEVQSNKEIPVKVTEIPVRSISSYMVDSAVGSYDIHQDPENGIISVDDSAYSSQTHLSHYGAVFGYTPRYSRWKFARDVVAGNMRDSMEFWHTFRKFWQMQVIGSQFVSYRDAGWLSNLNRIFADVNDNSDKFQLFIRNNCSVRRCLPLVPNTQLN